LLGCRPLRRFVHQLSDAILNATFIESSEVLV
jgi:hypothetical protein